MTLDPATWAKTLVDADRSLAAAIVAGEAIDPERAEAVVSLDFTDRGDLVDLVDLAAVARLPRLRNLVLTRTGVADLTPLADATALERLVLRHTPVVDLAPLARLSQLVELDLRATAVDDLAPLSGLANLRRLNIDATKVADLAALGRTCGLAVLDVGDGAALRRLDLSGLVALETLVAVAFRDATAWPTEWPATLRELILVDAAWPEGRALPDLPRMITPDGRVIDDGGPASEAFAFWRLVYASDEA